MEFIQNLDTSLLKFIHTCLGCEVLDKLCPILRTKTTWIPLYLILAYSLWKNYRRDYWKIILTTVVLVSFCDILCAQFLKNLFQRIRPCHLMEFSGWLRDFSLCSNTFSFPSCHAMNHAALASFVSYYLNARYKWLLFAWVLIIGFSQMYVGVHYPSDILGGMFIGWLVSLTARRLVKTWF